MAVGSIYNNYGYNNNVSSSAKKAEKETAKKEEVKTENKESVSAQEEESAAAVYEKGSETQTENQSSSISNKNSVYDKAKVQQMLDESNQKAEQFKRLIQSMFSKQGDKISAAGKGLKSLFENLQVDSSTAAQAKADIAEDGYWGVNKTSERILDFAKAIAGDDPEKIAEMRSAVEKGFKQATSAWGSELPSISQQTYDKVMSGFDEWEKSVNPTE